MSLAHFLLGRPLAVALAIILAAKFIEGAWITILAIPSLLMLFRAVHRHYRRLEEQTRAPRPLDLTHNQPPVVLVPTRRWDRLTEKALRFAMWLSADVIGVHLSNLSGEAAGQEEQRVRQDWANDVEASARAHGVPQPRLVMLQSPYRRFVPPMLEEIERTEKQYPGRSIAVVMPELVERHWWQVLLHRHNAARLRSALRKRGDGRVVVISVPWVMTH